MILQRGGGAVQDIERFAFRQILLLIIDGWMNGWVCFIYAIWSIRYGDIEDCCQRA